MKKINKKAIMFTILTSFLLLSLFFLSNAFFARNTTINYAVPIESLGSHLAFVEDDLVSNIYTELFGVDFINISKGAFTTLSLQQFNLKQGNNFAADAAIYETFIENTYDSLNNMDITVNNFNSSFFITPLNSTYAVNGSAVFLYQDDLLLNAVTLNINLNDTSGMATNTSPSGGTDVAFTTTFTWPGGSYAPSPILNHDITYSPIEITFSSGANIRVNYGRIGGRDGTLQIITNNLEVNVSVFDLRYMNVNEPIVLESFGNITIETQAFNMSKESNILLVEE